MAGKETAVMEPEECATAHGGRRGWARSGQSLVELALLLPMFTLILLGAVDLGRAFFYYNRMTAAVEQGGLFGIRYPTYMTNADSADPNNIKYVVTNEYSGMIATSDVTINCYTRVSATSYNCNATNGSGQPLAQTGDTIVVKATYNFKPITGQILRFLGTNYKMSKTVKMVVL